MMNDLIDSIKANEGFESKPYPDPIHGWEVPTFGHGLTYITEVESEMIVRNRVEKIREELGIKQPVFKTLTETRQDALIEMAYQLGIGGLMRFKKMWAAIEAKDFENAHDEALDSKWAKQTPKRAIRVANGLL
jgi:lysozyme